MTTLKFNVAGAKRKELAGLISRFTGNGSRFLGPPSFAYEVGRFLIDREGTVTVEYEPDSETLELLTEMLYDNGFIPEQDDEGYDLEISVPRETLSDDQIEHLKRLVSKKADLIKKVIGAEELHIEITDEKVSFPWFGKADPESAGTYTRFVSKLCDLARSAKRVNDGSKPVENEKYAFRCFLLRLGYIGEEYRADRKLLLANLSGSGAFKNPKTKEAEVCSD